MLCKLQGPPCSVVIMNILYVIFYILIHSSLAELSPKSSVELEKYLIILEDKFKINFRMNSEEITCGAYKELTTTTLNNLTDDLNIKFLSHSRKLEALMDKYNISGETECHPPMITLMNRYVSLVNVEYKQCISGAWNTRNYLTSTFTKYWTRYNSTRDVVLKLIDNCLNRFPLSSMETDRRDCVEKCKDNLNRIKVKTTDNYNTSPCMQHFESVFLECINRAEQSIKEWKIIFIKFLIHCEPVTNVMENDQSFRSMVLGVEEVKESKNLTEQVLGPQDKQDKLVWNILTTMEYFQDLEMQVQKRLKEEERREVDSYGIDTLFNPIFTVLKKSIDEQDNNTDCGLEAMDKVECIVDQAKQGFHICDGNYTEHINSAIATGHSIFSVTLTNLAEAGNASILKCFAAGNIWTTNTIQECFDLTFKKIEFVWKDAKETVEDVMSFLHDHIKSLPNPREPLECKEETLLNFKYDVQEVFYKYKRCMYRATGQNIALEQMFGF